MMKQACFGLRITAVTAAIALATLGVQAAAPQITNVLTSYGFEDDTGLNLFFGGAVGPTDAIERSTAQKFEGENSLYLSYDGEGGGDIFGHWDGLSFDASAPHDGYATTFQLYPVLGGQNWRGSPDADGGNHIGIQIFGLNGATPGGLWTDIAVGLMDSEEDGFAALGVMDNAQTVHDARYQRVADVPLEEWTKITVYRKPSSMGSEQAVELWVGGTLAGTYNDYLGDVAITQLGRWGQAMSVTGHGEFYVDDYQFGTGIEGAGCAPGDADGDGDVDDDDLSLLLANWGSETATCAQGEFSDVPPVNDDDLSLLLANWTGPLAAAVPEPATIALLVVAPALFRVRRKA